MPSHSMNWLRSGIGCVPYIRGVTQNKQIRFEHVSKSEGISPSQVQEGVRPNLLLNVRNGSIANVFLFLLK